MVRALCMIMIVGACAPAAADDQTWVYGGLGIGGGTDRFGSINGALFIDGHHWFSDRVGGFATTLRYGASENEASGTHASGRLLCGGVSVRHAWTRDENGWHVRIRAYGSLGLGVGHHSGTEWVSDESNEMRNFDTSSFAWSARVGIAYLFGPVLVGTQVVAYGFGRGGFAIAPISFSIGAGF